jgi:hypothetical protein
LGEKMEGGAAARQQIRTTDWAGSSVEEKIEEGV